ncbi:MAG: sigma-70 family RNA polymerase sigma factor [Planctomycetota bacterium]
MADSSNDPHAEVALEGDPEAVALLLEDFRVRIARMLTVRMDPRLRGRLDASDVIQDTFIEVQQRIGDYRRRRDMPFFLWVRFLAGQKLAQMHRKHLGASQRDARRELPDVLKKVPGATTATLAGALMSSGVTPSEVAMRMEDEQRLIHVLDELRELDREVLALRHFEGLSNLEVAQLLGIEPSAASRRYVRALARLQEKLRLAQVERARRTL